MHEIGVSEELAREHIRNMSAAIWKKMNEENQIGREHRFSKHFVETTINLAWIARCTYQYGDPNARANKRVLSTIIEPITLMKQNKDGVFLK